MDVEQYVKQFLAVLKSNKLASPDARRTEEIDDPDVFELEWRGEKGSLTLYIDKDNVTAHRIYINKPRADFAFGLDQTDQILQYIRSNLEHLQ